MPGPVGKSEAFQQLEAIMLQQMLKSSGAFRGGDSPGAQLRTDMFVETLADAVAKAGGLGIARMLERDLGGAAEAAGGQAHVIPPPPRGWNTVSGAVSLLSSPVGGVPVRVPGGSGLDDLDDPNSEAPLPEDPNAPSIDDYQPGVGGRSAQGAAALPPGAAPAPLSPAQGVTDQVTSGFGRRVHPITGDLRFHTGIDLRAAEGAPIRAAAGGIVREAGDRGGYGKTVELDHGDGTSTLYAHASQLLVEKGQRVDAGQPLALVGQTGQATGPHLHFELRRHDHPVNPASGNLPIPTARALNRYRERVEAPIAGTPPGVGNGEKP